LSAPTGHTQTNASDGAAALDATRSHTAAGDDRLSTIPGPGPSAEAVPPAVGRYTIVGEIARGGMGVVYRATDPGLNREVAVKLVRSTFRASPAAVRRFNDEAVITSQLQHPGIPPVHEVGTLPDGSPFLAMKLIKGRTLDELLRGRADLAADRGRFVAAFEQVCQAVGYAHAHKVIHRDLKPANVMVGAFGEVQVMDWGLAKVLSGAGPTSGGAADPDATVGTVIASTRDESGGTQAGSLLGTPAFLPPEQAMGAIDEVGAQSDVFGLGAILCVILTGKPPYVGADAEDTRKLAVRAKLDDAFGRLDGCGAEPDLVALCRRCLSAEKADRPADAGELAAAVAALRAAAEERARQAELDRVRGEERTKRRRVQLVLAGAVLLLVVAGAAGAGVAALWRVAEREKTSAEAARGEAETARDGQKAAREEAETAREKAEAARDGERRARESLAVVEYGRAMEVAHQEWREGNLPVTRDLLAATRADLRGWEWEYLQRLCHAELRTTDIPPRLGTPNSVAFSPDLTRIAVACRRVTDSKPDPKVVDARTGAVLLRLTGHADTDQLLSAAFSPDGSRIVTTGKESARVWDARTGDEVATLKGHSGPVFLAAFSPDGARVVTASDDKTARVWDARTGDVLTTLTGHTGPVQTAAFAPDGARIVTGSLDETVRVWDARTGVAELTLRGHAGIIFAAAFSPDGGRLLTGGADRTARVWDGRTGAPILVLRGHAGMVFSAAFSRDGARVVTGSADRTAKVWDARTGALLLTIKGHTSAVTCATFDANGTRVVTGCGGDATAKVWDARLDPEALVLRGHDGRVNSAAFSPDGTRIVTASDDKTARLWDAGTGAEVLTLKGHSGAVRSAAFSPDVGRVVTASVDTTARVWDARTGTVVTTLKGHTRGVRSAVFSPNGTRIVTAGELDGTMRVWDARTGAELLAAKLRGPTGGIIMVESLALSPDGSLVVAGCSDATIRVWDAGTGAEVRALKTNHGLNWYAAFSADGTRLAAGSTGHAVKVWDVATWSELFTLKGHTSSPNSAAFSPDGTRIVTGSSDGTARLWDARTGAEVLTLKGHTGLVMSVAFSPDGSRIVTAGVDGTVRIWDARPVGGLPPREAGPPPRPVDKDAGQSRGSLGVSPSLARTATDTEHTPEYEADRPR
jgi:WD40 repeat protein